MKTAKAEEADDGVRELTREDGWALFDSTARRCLNMSGDEFLRKWDEGESEDADGPGIMSVAALIPFVR